MLIYVTNVAVKKEKLLATLVTFASSFNCCHNIMALSNNHLVTYHYRYNLTCWLIYINSINPLQTLCSSVAEVCVCCLSRKGLSVLWIINSFSFDFHYKNVINKCSFCCI